MNVTERIVASYWCCCKKVNEWYQSQYITSYNVYAIYVLVKQSVGLIVLNNKGCRAGFETNK